MFILGTGRLESADNRLAYPRTVHAFQIWVLVGAIHATATLELAHPPQAAQVPHQAAAD